MYAVMHRSITSGEKSGEQSQIFADGGGSLACTIQWNGLAQLKGRRQAQRS